MTERKLLNGLVTLIDEEGGDAFIELGVEAIEDVKADFPWDGRGEEKAGLLRHPVKVIYQANIENPPWAEGKYNGVNDGFHMIRIKKIKKDGHPAYAKIRYYTLHEINHAIDADSLDGEDKSAIQALMDPRPSGWKDAKGGDSYWHLPSESFANRLVEAMVVPASEITSMFDDDYTRKITNEELDDLYATVLRGETHTGDGGEEVVDPPPPTTAELQGRIDQAVPLLEQAIHILLGG
jgi:hypothetical protein